MFSGKSIFSTSFEKVLAELGVDFEEITTKTTDFESIIQDSPPKIKKIALKFEEYAQKNQADLFLIGSRARGKKGIKSDWDFALYFRLDKRPKGFSLFKQELIDLAFPYRIDLVCLNEAPAWFLNSIATSSIRITKLYPDSIKLKEIA
ncbi:MAG: nucleotidyltransferase domain-containing protein [Pseudomonadota bacterium]